MTFRLKHRRTGSILFEGEFGSLKLCLMAAVEGGANLRYADLRYADLRGAILRYADLRYADLRYADLRCADLRDAIGNNNHIRTIQAGTYIVNYTYDRMAIGCESHSITDWWGFDDARIAEMARGALDFWRVWKPIMQQIITAAPAQPTGSNSDEP